MAFPSTIPFVVGDKRLWDITARFQELASTLPVGTLVKDDNFTLFESVGALEIMDPKMDSGHLQNGEALVDEYNLERVLLPDELIGIMDQFLCFEMAWHEGYPLAQTLFSSHYIDGLLSLEAKTIDQIHFSNAGKNNSWNAPLLHVVLRAFCIAIVKCCDYALEEVNRSLDGSGTRCNFYEEEDFSCHTYGRELFTRIPLDAIVTLLTKAIEFTLSEKLYSTQGKRLYPPEVYGAIAARLNLRLSTLRAMASETEYDDKITLWKTIPRLILPVKETYSFGRRVSGAFSPKIQRRLASTVPPKPMVEKNFGDAVVNLERICEDSQEALRIIHFGPDNVQGLKAFLWWFSSRKPEAWTYPRACLAALLFTCDDSGFEQLLRVDLNNLVLSGTEVLDPTNWTVEAPQGQARTTNIHFELAKIIDCFTEVAVGMPGGYVDFFRALTSNRCRVRRNLTHVTAALEDLQSKETKQLDLSLHNLIDSSLQYPLSTWTYLQKLRVMEWTVQLGFELDIYLLDEFAGMYHYLSLLARARHALLALMYSAAEAREAKISGAFSELDPKMRELKRSLAMLQSLMAEAQGTAALSSALSSMYIALSYLRSVESSADESSFHHSHLNYELRMKPFLKVISPPLPSFEEWRAQLHPFGSYKNKVGFENGRSTYLDAMDEHIRKAKVQFSVVKTLGPAPAGCDGLQKQWAKNTAVLLQSCIATGISCSTLRRCPAGANISTAIPKPGHERYHDWWVVPQLTQLD